MRLEDETWRIEERVVVDCDETGVRMLTGTVDHGWSDALLEGEEVVLYSFEVARVEGCG